MEHKISLEQAVYFTKLSVRLACTWPPPKHATKWQIVKEDIVWGLSILSALCLLLPLIISIYEYRSNSLILSQSSCFFCAGCNLIIKSIICRIYRNKCQVKLNNNKPRSCPAYRPKCVKIYSARKILIHEMEEFFKNVRPHEQRVLQQYVDKCWIFHAVVTAVNYLGAATVIFGPMVFPQPLPTVAVYPFSVDSGLALYLVYIHQVIAAFQGSSGVTIDCQVALMMWFASARLEILADEIRDSSNMKEFRYFVMKHQQLLSYAAQVSGTMCYIALTSTCMCGIGTVMSSLQLVGNQPFSVKMQYGPVVLMGLINLLICAWPAENLIRACDMVGVAAYNAPWLDISPKSMKDVLMVLQRSQRPVLVTVGGFLPALSMRFYASFLSRAFSYFTTVRLVVMDDDE